MWFIISSNWLFQWKCFISNKISNSGTHQRIRESLNKSIGILPPGPISNEDLLIFQGVTPQIENNMNQDSSIR